MLNLVIFGAPGSGKGTQSEKLIEKYNLAHISTGDVLRGEIKKGSDLGKSAKQYIDKGQLVPDDVIIGMLAEELETKKDKAGVIFDGFPRTLAQGEALDKMLKEKGQEVSAVICLDVDDAELVKRLLQRGRTDDNLDTIKSRLEVYKNQTSPLMDYYQKAGKTAHIKGVGSVDEIFEKISQAVDKTK